MRLPQPQRADTFPVGECAPWVCTDPPEGTRGYKRVGEVGVVSIDIRSSFPRLVLSVALSRSPHTLFTMLSFSRLSVLAVAAFGTLASALPALPVVGSAVSNVPGLSAVENVVPAVPGVDGLRRRDQKNVVTIINETTYKVQEYSFEFRECIPNLVDRLSLMKVCCRLRHR